MSHRAGHEDRTGENRPIRGDREKLQGHWDGGGPSGSYEWEAPWASALHAMAFARPRKQCGWEERSRKRGTILAQL